MRLNALVLTAVGLVGFTTGGAALAQRAAIPRPVSLDVIWPAPAQVERRDGNGLSIAGGVATVDGSDQYGLRSLRVDPERNSVSFTYVDAWTLDSASPPSCAFTFRHVERPLTQGEANALSDDLATAEMQSLKIADPGLETVGRRAVEGSAVTRRVDRFTTGSGDRASTGLSKTWVFVLDGKAYYVNKICIAPDSAALTVIDQLIGLNYRTGVTPPPEPPPVVEPTPVMEAPTSPPETAPAAPVRPSPWRMPRLRLPRR